MKLDPKQLEAVVNLRTNRDFIHFMEAIYVEKAVQVEQAINADGTIQSRAAGAAKVLSAVLKAVDEAPTTLERIKQQQVRQNTR